MKKVILSFPMLCFLFTGSAQIARAQKAYTIEILKAEDARRYDHVLERFLVGTYDEKHVVRALLAAGRIGDERAIPHVAYLLNDGALKVRETAVFALGEIESLKATDAVLKVLRDSKTPDSVRARAVEAAGKIAAANAVSPNPDADAKARGPKVDELGEAILDVLETEDRRGAKQNPDVVLLALTAALRARPKEAEIVAAKFLTNLDARIRADAANTLSRLRAKNANEALRAMLVSDSDGVARANAARALGAAEDKVAFDLLLEAATGDDDSRVRVSAIRSLASLKDAMATDKLLDRGEKLLTDSKRSKRGRPNQINEFLEIATVLGRLVQNTNDGRTVRFLMEVRQAGKFRSPEAEIAYARVAPERYVSEVRSGKLRYADWRAVSAYGQGLAALASLENVEMKNKAAKAIFAFAGGMDNAEPGYRLLDNNEVAKSIPDLVRGMAVFKPDNLPNILWLNLNYPDVFIRATAAELLGEQTKTPENIDALKNAYDKSLEIDKDYNDARLAILDALFKLDKKEAIPTLIKAVNSTDFLVRMKAYELLKDESFKDSSPVKAALQKFTVEKGNHVLLYSGSGSKLGVILNSQADYKRSAARKNDQVKAVMTTEKGTFTIDLLAEDAPLTVDNFIKLAKSGYFNGLEVHRVVPNFVMQDGDPRGDGNGGPGWSIRCEINMVPFERGAVGMALSGKDTGGSQWFVTHSPQPHLDGGYTVFGRVNETDMRVVDNIVRGDKIISVKIIEAGSPKKIQRVVRKK